METEPKPVVAGYPVAAQPHQYPTAATGVPSHGTAYPYPAPPYYAAPPPPPPGPYYQPGDNTTFLRRLIVVSIAIFLVVGFSTFIIWLVLRPRLPEFAVSSASVSSFNVSGDSQLLSGEFNLSLSVRNPNKKVGISCDQVGAVVLYGSGLISETSLPPFYLGRRNSTVVAATFATHARYVGADVANGIAKERSSKGGAVVFHARVSALVRFRSGAWRTRRHLMRVSCDDVKIGFANATAAVGALAGPPQACQVHI